MQRKALERWLRKKLERRPHVRKTPPPANPEIFKNGEPVALCDARMLSMESWTKKVAKESGQRVDWHYSGGIAQMLFLGDREKVVNAIRKLEKKLRGRVMRVYDKPNAGLYRADVTEAPEGAIGGFMDPLSGEQVYIMAERKEGA